MEITLPQNRYALPPSPSPSSPASLVSVGRVLFGLWLSVYLSLTLLSRLYPQDSSLLMFGVANTFTQTLLDVLIWFTARSLEPRMFGSPVNRKIFLWGFACSAVADLIYGTGVNVLGFTDTHGTTFELLYNIPFNLFLGAMAILCVRLALARLSIAQRSLVYLLAPGFVTLFYFYFVASATTPSSLQTYAMTAWSLLLEPLVLMGGVILFLFATTLSAQLIGGGLLIICSVNLFLQYLEFSGKLVSGIPFEAFWALGQLSIFSGLYYARTYPECARIHVDLGFSNVRARFILGLFALIAVLHLCWHLFFVSFGSDVNLPGRIFLSLIFFSLALIPLTFLFKSLFIDPVLQILHALYQSDAGSDRTFLDPQLREATVAVLDRLMESEKARLRSEALAHLATQVAHDIRSPLSSLRCMMLSKEVSALPAPVRDVVTAAILRIREIADTLLERNRITSSDTTSAPISKASAQNLATLLQGLILEKQAELGGMERVHLQSDLDPNAAALFVLIQPLEFKRSISNLINNAVEALGASGGRVRVQVALESGSAVVRVIDNGCGIPARRIPQLGRRGFTHGKRGGHGLGLYQAFESVKRFGGTISIDSEMDIGTRVTVRLPAQDPPDWFLPAVDFSQMRCAVCLDDDPSIHMMWRQRFANFDRRPEVEIQTFASGEQLMSWCDKSREQRTQTLFLIDYELRDQPKSGLDLIQELGIQEQAVLVTTRFEDISLQRTAVAQGFKLLPKALANVVPILA